jgi:hypothetical protein
VVFEMVTNNQNIIVDKASKIIHVINLHLDENPACRHSLDEILEDIENSETNKRYHWADTQQQKDNSAS